MKFATSLISVAWLCCHSGLATETEQRYYNDDDAADYLVKYDARVPEPASRSRYDRREPEDDGELYRINA